MKTASYVFISCYCIVTVLQSTTTTRTFAYQPRNQHKYNKQQQQNQQLKYNTNINQHVSLSYITQLYQTGGWGIGPQREMLPEEFARRTDNKRIFDGYQLSDRGEFMRQVQRDKDAMVQDEINELLGVANIAGINVKDPTERLNKFSPDDLPFDTFDTDDDLDLRIQWDDDNDNNNNIPNDKQDSSSSSSTMFVSEDDVTSSSTYNSRRRKRKTIIPMIDETKVDNDDSITRFDEDTGASGVW
jgi:hypothetical protein